MTRGVPTLGYPSKGEAIIALYRAGVELGEIARQVGATYNRVNVHIVRWRKSQPDQAWTPERLEKAKRLIALTFDEIARAMSVPVEDLRRLATTRDPGALEPVPDLKPQKPAAEAEPPAPVEADLPVASEAIHDDAAAASEEVTPEPAPAPIEVAAPVRAMSLAGKRLRLRSADGQYLHFSCTQMTRDRNYAWSGTQAQLRAVRRRWPETKVLRVVIASDAKVTP